MDFSTLVGKTLVRCEGVVGGEEIIFGTADGKTYRLMHDQSCCEDVTVEDICGDLSDLVGSPITQAEESSSEKTPDGATVPEYCDSYTWTFYRLGTAKGSVVIRWFGSSNGYYGEGVDFEQVQP